MIIGHKLPVVLSPEEIDRLLDATDDLKYKAIHAVSVTLDELSQDEKHLGTRIGYICILHTLGSSMNYHEFIRRFLMHVSPRRFVRIGRHCMLRK